MQPKPEVVQEYADSVPDDFTFSVKALNSLTLTHHYKKKKTDILAPDPHFLSTEFMLHFLEKLEPLSKKIGSIIFPVEYQNNQKMPDGLPHLVMYHSFHDQCDIMMKYKEYILKKDTKEKS